MRAQEGRDAFITRAAQGNHDARQRLEEGKKLPFRAAWTPRGIGKPPGNEHGCETAAGGAARTRGEKQAANSLMMCDKTYNGAAQEPRATRRPGAAGCEHEGHGWHTSRGRHYYGRFTETALLSG